MKISPVVSCWVYTNFALLILPHYLLKNFDLSGEQDGYLKVLIFNHKSEAVIKGDAQYVGKHVILFRENDQRSQKNKSIIQNNKLWLDTWCEMWCQCRFSHFHKKTFNTFGKEKQMVPHVFLEVDQHF